MHVPQRLAGQRRPDPVAALAALAVAVSILTGLAALAVPAASAAPAPKKASVGAGVGARPLQLGTNARAGGRYHLPSLYVVNTGNRPSTYRVRIERLGTETGRDVPAAWVRLARTHLRLQPHKSALIPVSLVLPEHAAGGDYRTNLVVGTSMRRPGRGAALGAAAADQLSFTIATPGFSWSSPWVLYPLLGLLAVGALVVTIRRLGLRIEIVRG